METIEIELEQKTKSVRSVQIPCFRKNNAYAYKVLSKERCLQVTHSADLKARIEDSYTSQAWLFEDTTDCTEGEFDALFNQTLERLHDLKVA